MVIYNFFLKKKKGGKKNLFSNLRNDYRYKKEKVFNIHNLWNKLKNKWVTFIGINNSSNNIIFNIINIIAIYLHYHYLFLIINNKYGYY